MKLYKHLISTLYSYYRKREPNNVDWYWRAMTTNSVCIILFPNLYSVYIILEYLNIVPVITNDYYILAFFMIFWLINYCVISKSELNEKYKETNNRNILYILLYLLISIILFIIIVEKTK